MNHRIKSFGYIIYKKSNKVKSEYENLSPNDYKKMRYDGVEFTDIIYKPLLGYTGDTCISGVLNYEEFTNVPLLLMECTGFSPEDIHVREDNHIHFDDIESNIDKFKNEKIILYHISQKYRDVNELYDKYVNKVNEIINNKIILFY
jgi:ribonuclease BN (tRNA processing enzyme)